jgi:hypothetical protein
LGYPPAVRDDDRRSASWQAVSSADELVNDKRARGERACRSDKSGMLHMVGIIGGALPHGRNARLRVATKIRRDHCSKFDMFEDTADFPGGFDRRGKLLIELGGIPIHLGQREHILRERT